MERSDGIIRLLKVNYASSQEALVLSANGNSRSALQHTVSDKENATSIINNIIRARENARSRRTQNSLNDKPAAAAAFLSVRWRSAGSRRSTRRTDGAARVFMRR